MRDKTTAKYAQPETASPGVRVPAVRYRCAVVLVSVLVATPLAVLPGIFASRDTTPKLAVLYLSSVWLLCLASRWWSCAVSFARTPVGRLFLLFLLLAAASLLVSTAFSGDPRLSLAGTVWRRLGAMNQITMLFIAVVLASHVYLDNGIARKAMLAMETAGAIASVYAILQYAGWDPLIPASLYIVGAESPVLRPAATLGQATYFGTFLVPVILIAAWFRLHERAFRPRRIHEVAFFLSIAALILSGTRSALLGLGVGACAFICLHRGLLLRRKTLARVGFRALAVACVGAAFLLLPSGSDLRTRLGQWATDWAGGPRLLVWRDSLLLSRQHILCGIGPERFEPEFRRTESLELARAFPDHYHESPHNFFLEVGLSQGAFGLAAWIALLALGCWCGVACSRTEDAAAGALLPALLGMLLSLQFCPLTITNQLYLLAIVAMLVGLAAKTPEHTAARNFRPIAASPALHPLSLTAAGALLLVILTYTAQDVLYEIAETEITASDVAAARRWFGRARTIPIPGPNLEVSRQFAQLARSSPLHRPDALTAAQQAAAVAEGDSAESFNALYQSATLAILAGDLSHSEAKLRAAIQAAPTWYRPRMILASVLWAQARNEEAEREAALALACAGRIEPKVKRTLQAARELAAHASYSQH